MKKQHLIATIISTAFIALIAACNSATGPSTEQELLSSDESAVAALAGCSVTCNCRNPIGTTVSCSASGANAECTTRYVEIEGGDRYCTGVSCSDDDGDVTNDCYVQEEEDPTPTLGD